MKKKNMWILIIALIVCGFLVAAYVYHSQNLRFSKKEVLQQTIREVFRENIRKALKEGKLHISKPLKEMTSQEIKQEFAPFAANIVKQTIDDLYYSTGNKISVEKVVKALPLNIREGLSIEELKVEIKAATGEK